MNRLCFQPGLNALRRRRADLFDVQGVGRLEDRQGGPGTDRGAARPDAWRCDRDDSGPVGWASNQWVIVRLGKACCSSFTPASVTWCRAVEAAEIGQPLQVHQPGVGDLVPSKVEAREVGQPLQIRQPGVGDMSAARMSSERFVSPFRCASPASVTRYR